MTLLGEVVEHAGTGRPLPGLGLGAAGKPELAEQDVAELLRAARIERLAGERLDFGLERAGALGEFARQPRQHLPIDGDAAPLHAREHRHQGALERLVDRRGVLGGHPRLEHMAQPQRHVGTLGCVIRGLVDRDAVEGDARFPRTREFAEIDRGVVEVAIRQCLDRVIGASSVEHVGHQHGVVERRELDAAQGKDLQVVFQVVPDLERARVFQQRFECRERRALLDLVGRNRAGEQSVAAAVAPFAMGQRDVAGLIGRDRKRKAAQRSLHRVETGGLGLERDHADVARAGDPGIEPVEAAHDLVARAIDLGVARGLDAGRGERLRRELLLRRRGGGTAGNPLARGEGQRQRGLLRLRGLGRAPLAPVPRGRRSGARPELAVGLDLRGVETGELRHPPRERAELHRLEKGDQALVVGLVHGEVGKRHVERDVGVEGDELLRQPRLFRIVDERLAPLLLLDLGRTRQERFEVAVFGDELRRGLHANARHARHVVGRIPDQGLHLDDLLRRHAEFLDHLGNADLAVLHGVVHDDTVVHELHQILVRGDDGRARARLAGLTHIGRDQVVGLETALLQAGKVEGAHRFADERELRAKVVGRLAAVGLVFGIHFIAKRALRLVEHDREVGWPLLRFHVAHELPQHVAEAEHGVDLQAIRFAVERRQRVIGAEDVGGAVDQEDVVALARRTGLDGGGDARGAVGALCGFGWHGPDLTLAR